MFGAIVSYIVITLALIQTEGCKPNCNETVVWGEVISPVLMGTMVHAT